MKKISLFLYRSLGLTLLAALTTVLVTYGFLMIFFMQNSNWIAPTVLSNTSDKMLQFQSSLLQQRQAKDLVEIQYFTARKQQASYEQQLSKLQEFKKALTAAIHNEIIVGSQFVVSKRHSLEQNKALSESVQHIRDEVNESRVAGLITEAEAVATLVSVQQFQNMSADSELSTNILSRQTQTLQGRATSVEALNAVRQQVDLDGQINTTRDNIDIAQATVRLAQSNLQQATDVLNTLQNTAYMHAVEHKGANLAFLPYENQSNIRIGAPIYDCYLLIVVCHQVGQVAKIYSDEQIIEFPIFNVRFSRSVRGTIIDMDMSTLAAMRSQILFFGHKPLVF